ncbi:terminase small subunit [Stenotrophomonas sp.]|uniref:terminase small subunit n=1 Tax=Stenotrophomonas sp. TaxID=69392 RepID=UPI0028AD73A5|nr:terminase small subunit [Stenotrophomonas sp.]
MLTPKQEAFAQAYVETGNASEAYRRAYQAAGMKAETVTKRASELLGRGDVKGRVAELQGEVQQAHGVTVATLIAELEEARQVAKAKEQGAAMVAATMGKAKLSGLDKEVGGDGDEPAPVKVEVTVREGRKNADPQ